MFIQFTRNFEEGQVSPAVDRFTLVWNTGSLNSTNEDEAAGMSDRIPVTVITGFLGAGKTTLLRHLLAHAGGRRIALIINEFGDIGVDGEVLKGCGDALCREEDVIELANGCICCTVAQDFIPTMEKLIGRPDPPDHILIETSGLALPQPLLKAFGWPEIKARVTVDGVVTVVDGPALAEGRFAHDPAAVAAERAADPGIEHESPIEELFEDQLNCADMVLLNKTDLLSDAETRKLSRDLSGQLRPGARLVTARHGQVSPAALIGLDAAAEGDLAARRSHHEIEGIAEHDHDDFESFVLPLGNVPDRGVLIETIAALVRRHGILRLKGFVALDGNPSRLVVQAVGPRLNHWFDRPWRDGEERRSSLVVIGLKGLDRARIEKELTV
jgi:cobalamin biosynthesis protein CobW